MKKSELMGDHWKNTDYSPLYQLYRRVETVARQLRDRQKKGWSPLLKHVEELYDISIQLKVLDKRATLSGAVVYLPVVPQSFARSFPHVS